MLMVESSNKYVFRWIFNRHEYLVKSHKEEVQLKTIRKKGLHNQLKETQRLTFEISIRHEVKLGSKI